MESETRRIKPAGTGTQSGKFENAKELRLLQRHSDQMLHRVTPREAGVCWAP